MLVNKHHKIQIKGEAKVDYSQDLLLGKTWKFLTNEGSN